MTPFLSSGHTAATTPDVHAVVVITEAVRARPNTSSSTVTSGPLFLLPSGAIGALPQESIQNWLLGGRVESGNAWVDRFDAALRQFTHLPNAWDSRSAVPPSREIANQAADVLELLWARQIAPVHASPTPEGGIVLSFFGGTGRASIEIGSAGNVYILTQTAQELPQAWEVDAFNDEELASSIDAIAATTSLGSTSPDVSVVATG